MSGSWRTDPTGRHLYRYHDGDGWTDHVADGGAATTDPYDGPPSPRPPGQPSPPSSTGAGGDAADAGGTPAGPGSTAAGGPWAASDAPSTPSGPSTPATPSTTSGDGGAGWPAGPPRPAGPGGWPSSSGQTWSSGGGRGGGWSTGAKLGAAAGVLGLVLISGAIGFAMGAATNVVNEFGDVIDEFDEGFDGSAFGDRPLPGEANDSGVVLSSDATTFDGTISGATTVTLDVARRSTVRIEVLEADFDTYLLLYDAQDRLISEDDDGGGSLLSMIDADLDPGSYRVVVDAFGGSVGSSEPIVLTASFDGLG